ncbi:hypothetical protein LTR56_000242 [Elasticomyces elasticus]|nr:hypothetical protein LTR22_022613 [Elasticomyces elasticus]KAK3661119.1 hypothetical protein LTR56_000242 [Elasticomyces elasticus]KAK4911678.1 hypothetical protein LTR49_019757 [Elasticomyces elasticus]KAK5751324.1 hypothetical protein LTS12_018640 [Elasticomyces elasticus]
MPRMGYDAEVAYRMNAMSQAQVQAEHSVDVDNGLFDAAPSSLTFGNASPVYNNQAPLPAFPNAPQEASENLNKEENTQHTHLGNHQSYQQQLGSRKLQSQEMSKMHGAAVDVSRVNRLREQQYTQMPPPHPELQLQQSQDQYTVADPLPENWRPELSFSRPPRFNLAQQWPEYDQKLYEGGHSEASSGSDEYRRQTNDYNNANSMKKYAQDPQPEINAQPSSHGPSHYKFAPTNNGYGKHHSLGQTYSSSTNDNTPSNFNSFGNNSMPVQPAPPGTTYSKFGPVYIGELTPAQTMDAVNAIDRPAQPQQRHVQFAGHTRTSQVGAHVNLAPPSWPQLDVNQYNDGM